MMMKMDLFEGTLIDKNEDGAWGNFLNLIVMKMVRLTKLI